MSAAPSPGAVRRELVELCSQGKVMAAYMRLTDSDLGAAEHPGLWEFLERQAERAGDGQLADRIRRALLEAGTAGPDMVLSQARQALDSGHPDIARIYLENAFGIDPDAAEARVLLGVAIARRDGVRALALLDAADRAPDADVVLAVDALRGIGALARARAICEAALARNPRNAMLANRLGWIAEGMGDLATARAVAAGHAKGGSDDRAQALGRLVRLHRRMGDAEGTVDHAAALLQLDAGVLSRLRLARTLGQPRLTEAIVAGLPEEFAGGRCDAVDVERAASLLLDDGLVGMVLWLWQAGLPVGRMERQLLARGGFGPGRPRGLPEDFGAARAIRSPDILFPLSFDRSRQNPPPGGWGPVLGDDAPILLVNSVLAAGGAERQFLMVARALVAAGVAPGRLHAALFSMEADRGHDHFAGALRETGISLHDLSRQREVSLRDLPERERDFIALLPARLRTDVSALHHLARRIEPAVIHGWQDRAAMAAGLVGQMLRIGRSVLSVRNMRPRKRGDEADWIARAVYGELAAAPGVALTANAAEGARDYEDWLGLEDGQVGLLSNAVDETAFAPGPPRTHRDGPLRLLGVFRLTANKRPLLWLETVAALRSRHGIDLAPRIVGVGPMAEEIRQAAERLGLRDLQLDPPVPDPGQIYRESDLLLLMSRVEGTPNVVLEAQACGLPVAACRVGGVKDAMHTGGPGGGLLLDADTDADAAAEALARWLPAAVAAPQAPRVDFIHRSYSMAALAGNLLRLYGARP